MSTIRVARRRRYAQVDRRAVNDRRLSFRARGVLVWLLDKPDDWRADAQSISAQSPEGRDAIRTALHELEDNGYLVRNKWRDQESGKWVSEHVVYEHPELADQGGIPALDPDEIHDGKPAPDNQRRVTSAGLSGAVLKKDTKTETNPPEPPSTDVDDEGFEEFWLVWPLRHGKRIRKAEALRKWKRMKPAERELAKTGEANYAQSIAATDTLPMDAFRWLTKELWVDWLADSPTGVIPIRPEDRRAVILPQLLGCDRCEWQGSPGWIPVLEGPDTGRLAPCPDCNSARKEA